MQKSVSFKIKGMQRDLSASAFNPEYAYENMNMRIMPTDENTLLSLINEKGNSHIIIDGIGDCIEGTPVGQAVIDNELILFSAHRLDDEEGTSNDFIYKIWENSGKFKGKVIYNGPLYLSPDYPLETLSIYENEKIKKVYWTDNSNQPRVINVAADDEIISKWHNTKNPFDFVRNISTYSLKVNITKNNSTNGEFAPGVLQYAFTYFDKYGQETNIFYTSPLYYISYNDRGASPEDKLGNSFNINITGASTKFDYIRIYSILRTSINSVPIVKRVVDISLDNTKGIINYTDNGNNGDSVDPTELLYIGGEEIACGTMTQKDNILFLGGIKIKRKSLDINIKNYFRNITMGVELGKASTNKTLESPNISGYYPYINQLSKNSQQITTYQCRETYRFGLQFQHYTGKWSDPIFIRDARINVSIDTGKFYDNTSIALPVPYAKFNNNQDIITKLHNLGYINVRPVVVFPKLQDREVICQGILCPTVYNVGDRYDNSPFVQSSWFTRPNAPFDYKQALYLHKRYANNSSDTIPLDNPTYLSIPDLYSRMGVMSNEARSLASITGKEEYFASIPYKGAWAEFRHNYPLPSYTQRNAEIQCIFNSPNHPVINKNDFISSGSVYDSENTNEIELGIKQWILKNSNCYYIDQSIFTLHSPEIEFSDEIKHIDTNNLKLRIVGIVPITSTASDIDIQTSTPVNSFKDSKNLPLGFYKQFIGTKNNKYDSLFGWKGLISGAFWFDEIVDYKSGMTNEKEYNTAFVVYPWHRDGSLNNTRNAVDGYKSAMLKKKVMSNIRYSYKTQYFTSGKEYNFEGETFDNHRGISGVTIFDSNEVTAVKIPAPVGSGLQDLVYYGNIDKLITANLNSVFSGYPIAIAGRGYLDSTNSAYVPFTDAYKSVSAYSNTFTGTDPIRMRYKSSPHAVIALNYTYDFYGENNDQYICQNILPTIKDAGVAQQYNTDNSITSTPKSWTVNDIHSEYTEYNSSHCYFWNYGTYNSVPKVHQDVIYTRYNNPYNPGLEGPFTRQNYVEGIQYGWLWLGELYRDNITNRFGGTTEEALENNDWVIGGESVSLHEASGGLKSEVTVKWTEGDTYFQRYDHLKTYPFSSEDQNQIVDIVSFMCETRINLDGRYDRNRAQISNLTMSPNNFNKINDVYSQHNNFFNFRYNNSNKLNINEYSNVVTWTKTKSEGELTDTWTNITLASTLNLDGDKGKIRALKRFNNSIIAFQDTGISQILYNENMQMSTTEGVPIEIANSGKVTGKRYISNSIGCTNKWSICETSKGLYFIDDITKGIYLFNGQLNNLSDSLGFHSWINEMSKNTNSWNPQSFSNFVTYYDKVNGDVFFINKDTCLAYSEPLGQFTSFYSYEDTPYFTNLKDKGIAIHKLDMRSEYGLWLHNDNTYCSFFGQIKPYYTTIIANPDMQKDKIFNNIEFRADSWDDDGNLLNTTFDTLTVWNEYQYGTSYLGNTYSHPWRPSDLKRKFRIWRVNIPRDVNSNNMNRMRNPWLYIKLSKEIGASKTILHDIAVKYFE